MDLNEFGFLVKTLRNSFVDESGNRWTRESLSKAIHLSPDQLGRLERGDRKYIDSQTLKLLADCFNLTSMERKEFYLAAVGLSDEELFYHQDPLAVLDNLIATVERIPLPVFISDIYTDIVAANTAAQSLFMINDDMAEYFLSRPGGMNLINLLYSSEFGAREIFGPLWREVATKTILVFRRLTLRYRHTPYFKHLIKEFLKEKQFDIDWYSSHRLTRNYNLTYQLFDFDHPFYGQLKYIATETMVNTKKGDLFMVIYNPNDPGTESTFAGFLKPEGNRVKKFAPWPEKKVPVK